MKWSSSGGVEKVVCAANGVRPATPRGVVCCYCAQPQPIVARKAKQQIARIDTAYCDKRITA